MDKHLQLVINRYICFRLLEDECGFNTVYDEQYEGFYTCLNQHYRHNMRRMSKFKLPTANGILELKEDYIAILRGAFLDFAKNGDEIDKNTVHILFTITKYLVKHYKTEQKGDCAYSLCIWLNNLLDKCTIEWDEVFVKNQRRRLMTTVGSTLYYWCYENIINLFT